jgi:uncharacterized protein RhaS with RHS repeats
LICRKSLEQVYFTQTDPIGPRGGINLYGYALGDPVNLRDPFGLAWCVAEWVEREQARAWWKITSYVLEEALEFEQEAREANDRMESIGLINPATRTALSVARRFSVSATLADIVAGVEFRDADAAYRTCRAN